MKEGIGLRERQSPGRGAPTIGPQRPSDSHGGGFGPRRDRACYAPARVRALSEETGLSR